MVSATEVLKMNYRRSDKAPFSTGTGMDSLLEGGVSRGQVVEISGPPGTGKTSIAANVATSALLRHHKVLWVCTPANPPPVQRLSNKSIGLVRSMRSTIMDNNKLDNKEFYDSDELGHDDGCHVVPVYGVPDLLAVIAEQGKQGSSHKYGYSVIVIDGLSGVVTTNVSKQFRPRATESVFNLLLTTARDYHQAILCTSTTTTARSSLLEPGLLYGQWDHGAVMRLIMYKDTVQGYEQRQRQDHEHQDQQQQDAPGRLSLHAYHQDPSDSEQDPELQSDDPESDLDQTQNSGAANDRSPNMTQMQNSQWTQWTQFSQWTWTDGGGDSIVIARRLGRTNEAVIRWDDDTVPDSQQWWV
uniref:ARAD1B00968p n=1 Tax=Blastobotrys adeninivorans TaxID=409370 RepID=A0A060T4N7_BLAAD